MVSDTAYFNGLLERISKTEHIGTFREFIDFVINESSHMQRHLKKKKKEPMDNSAFYRQNIHRLFLLFSNTISIPNSHS